MNDWYATNLGGTTTNDWNYVTGGYPYRIGIWPSGYVTAPAKSNAEKADELAAVLNRVTVASSIQEVLEAIA